MAQQPELGLDTKIDYLSLPASQLLDAYGGGSHIPGSGSAAAFSALIGIEMMRTVCKRTLVKPEYQDKKGRFEFVLAELDDKFKPQLIELFRRDIDIFNRVSTFRIQRDRTEKKREKAHWDRLQLDELRIATDVPIEVCKAAFEMLPYSFLLFDEGYRAVRGDSGVAISNLLSSISGALFIIFLNLRSFKKGRWVQDRRRTAERLAQEFERWQAQAFERVLRLYEEGLAQGDERQLTFEFFSQRSDED